MSNKSYFDGVKAMTTPTMVEVKPGRWVARDSALDIPERFITSRIKQSDGTCRLVPDTVKLAHITSNLLAVLGLPEHGWRILHKLNAAKFVEVLRVSPRCSSLNLDSYFNHLKRVAEDPDFWDQEGENFKLYTEGSDEED